MPIEEQARGLVGRLQHIAENRPSELTGGLNDLLSDAAKVIEALLAAWNARAEGVGVEGEVGRAAYREGLLTAARMVRQFTGEQYGENSALMIDADEGIQADKPTLLYVVDALERRAARAASVAAFQQGTSHAE